MIEECVDQVAKTCLAVLASIRQPHRRKPGVHGLIQRRQPTGRLIVDASGDCPRRQRLQLDLEGFRLLGRGLAKPDGLA
ncbi:MAG TPA: hypothetical protein VFC78_15340 [Tepidisphaeraceae bacterium]|nr:hypothetical protein [Tepidisphaeraceae bacterium]